MIGKINHLGFGFYGNQMKFLRQLRLSKSLVSAGLFKLPGLVRLNMESLNEMFYYFCSFSEKSSEVSIQIAM